MGKNTKGKSQSNKMRQRLLKVAYSFVGLYLIIWGSSSFVTHYFIADLLKSDYGLELSQDSVVRYNPFTSHLTVQNLSISKKGQLVFQLAKGDLEIRLHRLITKQVYISEFKIAGLFLTVEQRENSNQIAGVELKSDPASKPEPEIKKSSPDTEQEPNNFKLIMPKFEFLGGKVAIVVNEDAHMFSIKQFSIADTNLSSKKQSFVSRLELALDDAPIELDIALDAENSIGNLSFNLSLKEYRLSQLAKQIPDNIRALDGLLSFEAVGEIKFSDDSISIDNSTTTINIEELEFEDGIVRIKQDKQSLSVSDLQLKLSSKPDVEGARIEVEVKQVDLIGGNITAELNELKLQNQGQHTVARNISLELNEHSTLKAQLASVSLNMLASQIKQQSLLFESEGLKASVDKINLNLPLKSSVSVSDNSDPLFKIERVELANVKSFRFSDESISPEYKREVFIDEMEIHNIDAGQPLQQSPFNIKGRSDRYTKFEFAGFIKPFTEKTNLALKGQLMEVSLPPANGYIKPALGFQFESGELDTLLDIEIVDSAINGTTDVHIRGLELASTENYEQDTLKEQTAMPLNVALGMLKDGDGNVELEIPMLGDLDSPTFGYSSFITLITKKAIQAAAQSYLIKTFIPYAELLSITFSAGEFILKTRFEDLNYEPAQIAVSESQLPYMQQFVALMKDKEKTQVKVCAIATISDLMEKGDTTQTEEQKILQLQNIAQQRMIAFEEFAVSEGIESSRILTCTPKVDLTVETQAKVIISI